MGKSEEREHQALKNFEMISPQEANLRKTIGRTTLVIMSLYYAVSGLLLQWLPLPAGLAGLGWGGGVMLLRMGQQSQ